MKRRRPVSGRGDAEPEVSDHDQRTVVGDDPWSTALRTKAALTLAAVERSTRTPGVMLPGAPGQPDDLSRELKAHRRAVARLGGWVVSVAVSLVAVDVSLWRSRPSSLNLLGLDQRRAGPKADLAAWGCCGPAGL
jgi:hypothetical protein